MDWLTFSWNQDSGLLEAYTGDRSVGPVKVWTYSDFELYKKAAIYPSEYAWMVCQLDYLQFCKGRGLHLSELEHWSAQVVPQVVEDYFRTPQDVRMRYHYDTLARLRSEYAQTQAKMLAAERAINNNPFDPFSPIFNDVSKFLRELDVKQTAKMNRLDAEINEEEQWQP